jgi:hypothetical protein
VIVSDCNKVRLHVCEQQASNGGKKGKGVNKGAEKSIKGSDKIKDGAEEKNKKVKKRVRKRKCEVETKERNKRMRSAPCTLNPLCKLQNITIFQLIWSELLAYTTQLICCDFPFIITIEL